MGNIPQYISRERYRRRKKIEELSQRIDYKILAIHIISYYVINLSSIDNH